MAEGTYCELEENITKGKKCFEKVKKDSYKSPTSPKLIIRQHSILK